MGKRCFNYTWLDKVDLNNHMVLLWCIRNMKEQQHANSVKMIHRVCGLSALKQHSRKIKTSRIFSTLGQSLTGHETDPKADTGIEKTQKQVNNLKGKLMSQSYLSSSSERAVQPPRKACVKMPHLQLLAILMKRFGL